MAIYSYDRYESTGQSEFAITFDYLSTEHIEVYLDGVEQTSGYTIDAGTNKVTFASAPDSGTVVFLRRVTPKTKAEYQAQIADFQDGSVLTEKDLDTAVLGLLYISQEAEDSATSDALGVDHTDEQWDALDKRIKDVATPTGANDAVTKEYVDGLELYDAPSIPQLYSFTATADQTTFVMSPVPTSTNVNTFIVDLDGVVQKPTTDFTISGATLTLGTGASVDQVLTVRNIGVSRDILEDNPSVAGDLTVGGELDVTGDTRAAGTLSALTNANVYGTLALLGDVSGDVGAGTVKSTGASSNRSLESRFAEVVNVKDFGATGDGTTDDSQAIKDAIAYAEDIWDNGDWAPNQSEPAVLYFPSGVYECNNTQFTIKATGAEDDNTGGKWPARPTIRGVDRNASIIKNGGFLIWGGAGNILSHESRPYDGLVSTAADVDYDPDEYSQRSMDHTEISDMGFLGPWVRTGDEYYNNDDPAVGDDRYNNSMTAWFTNDDCPRMTGTLISSPYTPIVIKVPWSDSSGVSTTVPSTAIEIGWETRHTKINNVWICGYNYGVHDSTGGAWDSGAATGFIRDAVMQDVERGIVIHSSGWMIKDFWIHTCAKEGILIESQRVGVQIENTQILDGECYGCGYGGLVIRTVEKDMDKRGRYTTHNYEDGVIPSETTEYGAGWLGDWGETTTNNDWEYDDTTEEWTDPWGVKGVSPPIVPYVFNTRVSQCSFGTTQGKNLQPWKVKALHKYSGTPITYYGDAGEEDDEWCEIEFDSTNNDITDPTRQKEFNRGGRLGTHFPRGIANQMSCTSVIKTSSSTGGGHALNTSTVIGATDTHRIVISAKYAALAPTGYTEGADLHTDSEISPVIDVVFGKGNFEGMITDNRFNHTYMGGCAFYRFTNNRLKSSFWMADTCVGLSFTGSRTAINQQSYIGSVDCGIDDCDGVWEEHVEDGVHVYANSAGLDTWGDRLFNGPGAVSGWVSMEMVSTQNTPEGPIVPKIRVEVPKEGTTTQFDGAPEQLVGIVVSPTGVEIQGQLDKGTEKSLAIAEELQDMGGGTYWITAAHAQAPTVVDDETHWLVENHRTAASEDERYPIVRGWKAAGYTTTVYGGHIDADGTDTWSRLDHDA